MRYNIYFSTRAEEELCALDKSIQVQLLKRIARLGSEPDLGKPLSNELKNQRSLRVGKYRAVYYAEGSDVVIARIGHRKKVY